MKKTKKSSRKKNKKEANNQMAEFEILIIRMLKKLRGGAGTMK